MTKMEIKKGDLFDLSGFTDEYTKMFAEKLDEAVFELLKKRGFRPKKLNHI